MFIDPIERVKDSNLSKSLEDNVLRVLKDQYNRVVEMLLSQREQLLALAKDIMLHRKITIGKDNNHHSIQ